MMGQEEAVQDNQDVVASEVEKEKESEEKSKTLKRKMWIYNALAFFALGLLIIFAPVYIQTDVYWVVSLSFTLCGGCWGISGICIREAYPDLPRNLNTITAIILALAIVLYIASESGSSPVPSDPYYYAKYRAVSFLLLVSAVMLTIIRLPELISSYERNKNKIKALSTAKNIFAAVGAAVVFLTALFQFLQVLLQILHR